MRFHIDGIQCAKCIRKLETLPETLPGLTHLRIDSGANLAYAEIDQQLLSFSQLAMKLNSMGFRPTPILSDSEKITAGHRANRTELIRLAIAAACAGNIMMFSFANYLGSTGIFRSVFSWLSFALYLPVVTYVAWPFYTGALSSLRQKQVSIDLPMAVASLAGFFYSAFELFNGRENFYFDSLSGFLFLILISRWMQGRLQKSFLTRESNETLGLEKMRKLSGEDWYWVPAELLQPGDKIRILRDETVPVDGTVISPRIRISLAWLSGESKSVSLTKNSTIKAGARIISESADIHVQRLTQHTEFGQLLDAAERFSLSNNRFISMSDKWSERLLIAVFAIAALYLTFNVSNDMEESFRRALALIVIACPCAMAFGTPLALSSALRKARKNGLLVRDANVFERCAHIRTLFFDKTGTLTENEISLVEDPESYSDELKSVVLTLEAPSQHPIAYAFRQAFTKSKILTDVTEWSEKPGEGISARIGQDLYEIKKCAQATTACALFKNGELTAQFTFSAQLRVDALSVLEKLRQGGYQTLILSGDSEE
ncbi:MAG: HAD-IC family P-type ATPase, partial [Bdellovibrionota bacterium]